GKDQVAKSRRIRLSLIAVLIALILVLPIWIAVSGWYVEHYPETFYNDNGQPEGQRNYYVAHYTWDRTTGFKTFRLGRDTDASWTVTWQYIVRLQVKQQLDSNL